MPENYRIYPHSFKRSYLDLLNTNWQTMYTVAANKEACITSFYFCNLLDDNSSITFDVRVVTAEGKNIYLLKNIHISERITYPLPASFGAGR